MLDVHGAYAEPGTVSFILLFGKYSTQEERGIVEVALVVFAADVEPTLVLNQPMHRKVSGVLSDKGKLDELLSILQKSATLLSATSEQRC